MKEYQRVTLVEALEIAQRCGDLESTRLNLERIEAKLLSLLQGDLPKGSDPTCLTCLRTGPHMGPSHDGSKGCESGSIASGGDRSHCTCSACF